MYDLVMIPNQVTYVIYDKGAYVGSVCVGKYKDGVWAYLLYIQPKYRRQGMATLLMETVMTADVPVYLYPDPIDGSPISKEELTAWYLRNGFVKYEENILVSYPNNWQPTNITTENP